MKQYPLFLFAILLIISCAKEDNEPVALAIYDTTHTIDWMSDFLTKHADSDVTLRDISMPAAHDAGVYVLNNCNLGNACNTQTQYLNMTDMLASGIRVFDVRPVFKDGAFWTYHATNCNGLGCEGEDFTTFLQQTKDFLDRHNELVIFEVTHFCNTSPQDAVFLALLQDILGDRIYKETTTSLVSFVDKPLDEVIPTNGDGGKIILLMEGLNDMTEDREEGFFAPSFIPLDGSYANRYIFDEMLSDQKAKFQGYDASNSEIFSMSYTLTLNDQLAVECVAEEEPSSSIESLSIDARNRLESTVDSWLADNTITQGKIPHIIYADYVNTTLTEQCIRISEFNIE
ncbi:MAG: hypothetical protein ACPG4Z_01725 [Chitinophagales bacterium]